MARLLRLAALPWAVAAASADTMRAGALTKKPLDLKVHLENFQEIQTKTPSPKQGEVLIQVEGASVNPVEWKVLEIPTYAWSYTYPRIAGHDVSGTVVALGEGTSRLKVGDKVWGISGNEGAHAEYVTVAEENVALAPTKIPLANAGTLPLVALTNLQGFRWAKGPWTAPNYTVVVLGGSGGTGHTAIQMAKAFGATTVITTCGTSNVAFCKSLGADQVIDYHKEQWQQVVAPKSVDFVYDTVAAKGTGDLAYPTIKDGGFFATLLSQSLASDAVAKARPSVSQSFYLLNQLSYKEFDILKGMADEGKLIAHIDQTFGLSEIAQVFNTSLQGHTVGKVLVLPSKKANTVVV